MMKKRNKTINGLKQRMKKVQVDVANRLERSFGSHIEQTVEIHYQGKPMTFVYAGPIETISIDVLHANQEIGNESEVEHFDPTKERLDQSQIYLECKCGGSIRTYIPTDLVGNKNKILGALPKSVLKDIAIHHHGEGHGITLDHIETETRVIPEEKRIKNFSAERINFYRLFPKKTTEVRYLASYGQDLLAEAPQYKYSETRSGQSAIGMQNMMFIFFLFGLMEIFTFFASTTATQPNYFATHVNNTPWYVLIVAVVLLISIMWRLHIHDIGKTMVKVVQLQSGPFYISNRGILPVIMTNSTLTLVWDYQGKMMQINDDAARNVYYHLQNWSDATILLEHRAKILGQTEKELMDIHHDLRDIQKIDYEYRTEMTEEKKSFRDMIYAVALTVFGYSFVLMLLAMLGVSI